MIRHALVLSAGWGTRLRPLTFFRPKALMPLGRESLIEKWLFRLKTFDRIFINVHAMAPLFGEYLRAAKARYSSLEILYESRILGSGGSIIRVCEIVSNEWILTLNADSFTSVHFDRLFPEIITNHPSICLFLKDEPPYNNVVVDPCGYVRSIRRRVLTKEEIAKGFRILAYVGIQVIHSGLVTKYLSGLIEDIKRESNPDTFLDIMEIYSAMIEKGFPVRYVELPESMWRDIGTVDSYMRLCLDVCRGSSFGKNVTIEPGAVIKDSIIWDGVRVKAGSQLDNCIVTDGVVVNGSYHRQILTPTRIWRF